MKNIHKASAIGLLATVISLYTPWDRKFELMDTTIMERSTFAGYSWIWLPPTPEVLNHPAYSVVLNGNLIAVELVGLLLLIICLFWDHFR